ncbi:MAG: hypothetical protein GY944_02830 [bacterium]|nr:hypothetical protein [bacterium]
MAEYADQLGVAPATLYQWNRRLSSEAAEFETPVSMGLVEVAIGERPSDSTTEPIVVRLGNRCVELPRRFDDEDLIRLIEILEAC